MNLTETTASSIANEQLIDRMPESIKKVYVYQVVNNNFNIPLYIPNGKSIVRVKNSDESFSKMKQDSPGDDKYIEVVASSNLQETIMNSPSTQSVAQTLRNLKEIVVYTNHKFNGNETDRFFMTINDPYNFSKYSQGQQLIYELENTENLDLLEIDDITEEQEELALETGYIREIRLSSVLNKTRSMGDLTMMYPIKYDQPLWSNITDLSVEVNKEILFGNIYGTSYSSIGNTEETLPINFKSVGSQLTPIKIQPTEITNKVEYFHDWADLDMVMRIEDATSMISKNGLPLSTLFTKPEDINIIKDIILFTYASISQYKQIARNDQGKFDPKWNIGINQTPLNSLLDSNDIQLAINKLFEEYLYDYPEKRENGEYRRVKSVAIALSRHVRWQEAIAKGNNPLGEVYLPWYLELTNRIELEVSTTPADTLVIKTEPLFKLKSKWYDIVEENETTGTSPRNVGIYNKDSVDLTNSNLIQLPERKMELGKLDAQFSSSSLKSSVGGGDINPNSIKDFNYVLYGVDDGNNIGNFLSHNSVTHSYDKDVEYDINLEALPATIVPKEFMKTPVYSSVTGPDGNGTVYVGDSLVSYPGMLLQEVIDKSIIKHKKQVFGVEGTHKQVGNNPNTSFKHARAVITKDNQFVLTYTEGNTHYVGSVTDGVLSPMKQVAHEWIPYGTDNTNATSVYISEMVTTWISEYNVSTAVNTPIVKWSTLLSKVPESNFRGVDLTIGSKMYVHNDNKVGYFDLKDPTFTYHEVFNSGTNNMHFFSNHNETQYGDIYFTTSKETVISSDESNYEVKIYKINSTSVSPQEILTYNITGKGGLYVYIESLFNNNRLLMTFTQVSGTDHLVTISGADKGKIETWQFPTTDYPTRIVNNIAYSGASFYENDTFYQIKLPNYPRAWVVHLPNGKHYQFTAGNGMYEVTYNYNANIKADVWKDEHYSSGNYDKISTHYPDTWQKITFPQVSSYMLNLYYGLQLSSLFNIDYTIGKPSFEFIFPDLSDESNWEKIPISTKTIKIPSGASDAKTLAIALSDKNEGRLYWPDVSLHQETQWLPQDILTNPDYDITHTLELTLNDKDAMDYTKKYLATIISKEDTHAVIQYYRWKPKGVKFKFTKQVKEDTQHPNVAFVQKDFVIGSAKYDKSKWLKKLIDPKNQMFSSTIKLTENTDDYSGGSISDMIKFTIVANKGSYIKFDNDHGHLSEQKFELNSNKDETVNQTEFLFV